MKILNWLNKNFEEAILFTFYTYFIHCIFKSAYDVEDTTSNQRLDLECISDCYTDPASDYNGKRMDMTKGRVLCHIQ